MKPAGIFLAAAMICQAVFVAHAANAPPIPASAHLDDAVEPPFAQASVEDAAPLVNPVIVGYTNPPEYRVCDFQRTGWPQCVHLLSIPSRTHFYGGYYVGGGAPVLGEGPYVDEGTWGWDYAGILFDKRIALNWTHGARYQGGTGAYRTDGPHRVRR